MNSQCERNLPENLIVWESLQIPMKNSPVSMLSPMNISCTSMAHAIRPDAITIASGSIARIHKTASEAEKRLEREFGSNQKKWTHLLQAMKIPLPRWRLFEPDLCRKWAPPLSSSHRTKRWKIIQDHKDCTSTGIMKWVACDGFYLNLKPWICALFRPVLQHCCAFKRVQQILLL